jgi:hypothetical protein
MKITVLTKNVYGKQVFYPACETAKKFCSLLGTKTLTEDALMKIKDIGYEIVVTHETIKF